MQNYIGDGSIHDSGGCVLVTGTTTTVSFKNLDISDCKIGAYTMQGSGELPVGLKDTERMGKGWRGLKAWGERERDLRIYSATHTLSIHPLSPRFPRQTAEGNGGCVSATSATLDFKGVNFQNCQARVGGGALHLAGGATATIESNSVTMTNNVAATESDDILVDSGECLSSGVCVHCVALLLDTQRTLNGHSTDTQHLTRFLLTIPPLRSIWALASLTCKTSCIANEVPSTSCSQATMNTGVAECPIDCGTCVECTAGSSSAEVGSVSAIDCSCSLPFFLSYENSNTW